MRRIAVLFIVSILLTATVTLGLNAQPDDLEPILISTEPIAYRWSADGQALVFADGTRSARVNLEQGDWIQYDVDTEQLIETPSWPLQPTLTDQEREMLRPIPDSFIFESPNKNYLAYAAELNPEYSGRLAVGERPTLSFVGFDDKTIYNPTSIVKSFNVQWNLDNSAFVVTQPTPYAGYEAYFHYYVSGFEEDMSSARSVHVPSQFGERYFDLDVFDLSQDGHKVLMYGREIDPNQPVDVWKNRFVIWDAANPEASLVLDGLETENVLHGSFIPGSDGEQLLFVDVDGISAYDIATNQKTVLYPEINATLFQQAWFSPDSSHLAFVRQTRYAEVFVIDLSDYITLPTD